MTRVIDKQIKRIYADYFTTGLPALYGVHSLVTGYIFDLSNNYQMAFFICASIGIIGLALTILLKPIPVSKTSTQSR